MVSIVFADAGVDTVDEALALIKEAIEYGQGRVVISQATAEVRIIHCAHNSRWSLQS